jgi:integrase/recombinase XerC
VREGLIESNPATAIRGPKLGRPLPHVLDVDQAGRAMVPSGSDALEQRDRAMLELFYSSGLRLSELTGLDRVRLDLDAGLVRVLGKGRRERTVPVGRMAREALRDWLAKRPELAAPEEMALFVSLRGRRLSNRAVQNRIARAGMRAGLGERLHPHRLRHAFASHMLESSGDLRAVQELLGHADLATTQIYTHLDFQHLAQVYDKAHPRARRRDNKTGRGQGLRLPGDESALGACRTWVPVASRVGERGQFFMISRRIVVLCNEKSGKNAPLFPPAQ